MSRQAKLDERPASSDPNSSAETAATPVIATAPPDSDDGPPDSEDPPDSSQSSPTLLDAPVPEEAREHTLLSAPAPADRFEVELEDRVTRIERSLGRILDRLEALEARQVAHSDPHAKAKWTLAIWAIAVAVFLAAYHLMKRG